MRIFAILNLVFGLLALPLVGLGLLFGLAGSDKQNFWMMAIGYLGVLIFSALTLFKPKLFKFIFVFYFLFGLGAILDRQFWKEHNGDLCSKLRSDPYCKESDLGFNCEEPSPMGNFSTAKTICR